MIIVNKNGASLGKTFADLGVSEEAKVSNGAIFEKALQTVAQPQSVQHSDVNVPATPQKDWQNTLAQEKLIQDQLAVANTSALMVTGPGDVSLGNNDPVFTEPQPVASAQSAASIDPVLRNIIAWRQEQMDPMLHVRVGDTWAKQGIEDPFNEPHLISQAQEILATAQRRLDMNPGTKAPWEGDWQSALAKERATEAQRIAVLVEGSKNSNFVAGG
jgi:hypothetical protein